jgi:hypothetical protein
MTAMILITSLALNSADERWQIKQNVIKAINPRQMIQRGDFTGLTQAIQIGATFSQEILQTKITKHSIFSERIAKAYCAN